MQDALTALLAQGEALVRQGSEDEAIPFLSALAEQHPGQVPVQFALAGAFDFASHEERAVSDHRAARKLGLNGADLQRWFVQMGSTLRNVGRARAVVCGSGRGVCALSSRCALPMFTPWL